MAIRFPGAITARRIIHRSVLALKQSALEPANIPKGYCAVYVGEEEKKRFLVPISYLNEPVFQNLLSKAEEEFGYDHPMGGLTIPCSEDIFNDLTARLNEL